MNRWIGEIMNILYRTMVTNYFETVWSIGNFSENHYALLTNNELHQLNCLLPSLINLNMSEKSNANLNWLKFIQSCFRAKLFTSNVIKNVFRGSELIKYIYIQGDWVVWCSSIDLFK